MRDLISVIAFASYLAGIAIAKGFWMTTASILFVPYAWYLLIERYVA